MKKAGLYYLLFILMFSMGGCLPEDEPNTLEGSWSCTETSTIFMNIMKGTSIYPVYIAQDILDDNTYYIDNFYQLGEGYEVKVVLNGNTITLARQTVDDIVFEGTGIVNPDFDVINLTYTADDGGGQTDQVTAEYSR